MKILNGTVWLLLISTVIIGCGKQGYPDRFLAPGFYDFRETIKESGGELIFLVSDPYPGKTVTSYYDRLFRGEGYTVCQTQVQDWEFYHDLSGGHERVIFHQQKAAIDTEYNRVLFLVLSYHSDVNSTRSPTSDTMSVSVQIVDYEKKSEKASIIDFLNLSC